MATEPTRNDDVLDKRNDTDKKVVSSASKISLTKFITEEAPYTKIETLYTISKNETENPTKRLISTLLLVQKSIDNYVDKNGIEALVYLGALLSDEITTEMIAFKKIKKHSQSETYQQVLLDNKNDSIRQARKELAQLAQTQAKTDLIQKNIFTLDAWPAPHITLIFLKKNTDKFLTLYERISKNSAQNSTPISPNMTISKFNQFINANLKNFLTDQKLLSSLILLRNTYPDLRETTKASLQKAAKLPLRVRFLHWLSFKKIYAAQYQYAKNAQQCLNASKPYPLVQPSSSCKTVTKKLVIKKGPNKNIVTKNMLLNPTKAYLLIPLSAPTNSPVVNINSSSSKLTSLNPPNSNNYSASKPDEPRVVIPPSRRGSDIFTAQNC